MDYKLAKSSDAQVVQKIMIEAFREYNKSIPSNALEETVDSIFKRLESKEEKAVICIHENIPIGMARFKIETNQLYFFRLAILPSYQGKGIAKSILEWLEIYATNANCSAIWCKVRKSVTKNIQLYQSFNYTIFDEFVVNKADGTSLEVVSMKKDIV